MHVTHDLNIGGLQRVVVDLAKNIDRNKFEVSVCALREGGPFEKELTDQGIEVIRMPPMNDRPDYFRFWKLYKIMIEKKTAVVHTHNIEPFTDGVPAALLARVPVRVHTDHARVFPDKKRYMFAEWILSHFTSQLVAVSEHTKANLVQYEKINSKKIKVVLNGIAGEKYRVQIDKEQKKAALGIGPGRAPILGVSARLTRQKGISYLLQAVKLLSKDYPDTLLLIAGEGELWDQLNAEAKELRIERNVLFLGPRLDVPEILQLQDVFVLPSLFEGLPLVLLEAMAASLPIVATDVGGNRQAVRDGLNGFIVPSKDSVALCSAIKRLIENSATRESFSRNSLELFQKEFALERMVKTYEEIYLNCLVSTN